MSAQRRGHARIWLLGRNNAAIAADAYPEVRMHAGAIAYPASAVNADCR